MMLWDALAAGAAALLALPSWNTLESKLPSVPAPVFVGSLPPDIEVGDRPVFHRDAAALCPSCQQIWLALEMKDADYLTVLVEDVAGAFPVLTWPDGLVQSGPALVRDMLETVEVRYADRPPEFYRRVSASVDNVRCNIVRFAGIFPRDTLPSVLAPYLLKSDGAPVPDADHHVTLEEIDEVLEEYDDGPFLCGDEPTAADVFWAPHMERYAAQLPRTRKHASFDPRSREYYPEVMEWYAAMETIPCYSCRVAGDRLSWERVLEEAAEDRPHLAPVPARPRPVVRKGLDAAGAWKKYVRGRPWMAPTPVGECAAFLIRGRGFLSERVAEAGAMAREEADEALREVVDALLLDDGAAAGAARKMSEGARDVVRRIDREVRAPRDMGFLAVAPLRRLAAAVREDVEKGEAAEV